MRVAWKHVLDVRLVCHGAWVRHGLKVTMKIARKIISSMPRRLKACVGLKGAVTPY